MMKRRTLLATALAAAVTLSVPAFAAKPLVIGFSQVGAESEWRTANTVSIKDAAKKDGVTLKFADAQQKQENQVKAIRSFIAQRVDVIAFSPVVESGWDTVLREAKARQDPGDPDRPRGQRQRSVAVRELPRLGLRGRGPPRRPLAGRAPEENP
jgi:simple sugar transport system substrate-binding protein